MRKNIKFGLGLMAVAITLVTILVEVPSSFAITEVKDSPGPKALILYHPSRDSKFSDDLSLALAEGLHQGGVHVDRATISLDTPDQFHAYKLIAVVSNTYFWTPDLPTLLYLRRANLEANVLLGLIGGAGSTDRAQALLETSLRQTGGTLLGVRPFWLMRPNDEARLAEPNREVALDLARRLGRDTAAILTRDPSID